MTRTPAFGDNPPVIHSRQFSTPQEAAGFLQSLVPISREAWGDAKITALINDLGIITKEPLDAPIPPGGFPALVKRYRWVIRNDDLSLFDSILEGLRSTASAGFFFAAGVTDPVQWGAVVGLTTALFKLFRSVLLRGKQLSPDLFSVLIALKNGGPATIDELTERLHKTDQKWDTTVVQTILDSLKSFPMSDGTARQLVAKGHDERWQVSGV